MSKLRMKAISEQVIVITDAASSIGRATASLASERGAKVVLCSQKDDELRALTEELRQKGGEVYFILADVTRYEDLIRIKEETMRNFGRVDTWINNAAYSLSGYLMDTPLEEERKLFDLNFWGTRMGCQVAVDCMKETGGTIVNLGSEISVSAQPLLGIYSASKEAVKIMTDALRSELRDRNIPIEVTLIRPTAMDTPFAEAILKSAENPQRDVYVGGPAKLSAIIDTFFPQVKDMVAETRMKELKRETDAPQSDEDHHIRPDYTTLSFIKTITSSARKSFGNFRRAG